MKIAMLFAAGLVASAAPVTAATYTFNYFDAGRVISGTLSGTAAPGDSNTVLVSSLDAITVNGFTYGPHFLVTTFGILTSLDFSPVRVTFDGSDMAMFACLDDTDCTYGFAIENTQVAIDLVGAPFVTANYADISTNITIYSSANWSLFADAVPEPVTWSLLITGFGMTGVALRRRRTVAVVRG